jgi:hypothetical protein
VSDYLIRVVLQSNAPQYSTQVQGATASTEKFAAAQTKAASAADSHSSKLSGQVKQVATLKGVVTEAASSFLGFVSAQTVMTGLMTGVRFLTDTIVGFDDEMTQSLAIMGDVSDTARASLEATARSVAVDYNMAVKDTAQSYYFLVSAGYDVASSQAALPQVTAFAKAGMLDLEAATELAADAQNAMGLKSNDAGQNLVQLTRITDVLTKANIDANGSVDQFAKALTNKAAAASRLAGISLEETVGVLEAFASQGLKGKRAGEAYAIVLRDLQAKARVNADAFHGSACPARSARTPRSSTRPAARRSRSPTSRCSPSRSDSNT